MSASTVDNDLDNLWAGSVDSDRPRVERIRAHIKHIERENERMWTAITSWREADMARLVAEDRLRAVHT